MSDETALEVINAGAKVPATIVDDYIFDAWSATFPKLRANRDVAVSQDGILAWATRRDAPKLLEVMNAFFSTQRLWF
jgi:membrane-bound lytic murein transglycosylase MltF